MIYRIVKLKDLKQIVELHYSVRDTYSIGIFSSLNKGFLRKYYKILINDPYSVIVCAEDDSGKINGFCSATLNVDKQFSNIKAHKFQLGFSALRAVLSNPSIVKELLIRYRSVNNTADQFISREGARLEYWVWSKEVEDSVSSLVMHEALLQTLKALGVQNLNFEVDTTNKRVLKFHRFNGAQELNKIMLPDKRERALLKYDFNNRVSKIKLYN